jgi:hypothetical protein
MTETNKFVLIILLFMLMFFVSVYIGRISKVSCECPTDSYWEQQYDELKKAYQHDEELLKY